VQQQNQPNPKPVQIKQKLPLPKNAVLLSLIQASEPARRGAEVEAPPTPKKSEVGATLLTEGSITPPPNGLQGVLPKFNRPSPLFLDASMEHDNLNLTQGGSMIDDEEHKIRVGTYLEGGPCGTYAVASKTGLLVYPTLFEYTLPDALNTPDEDCVNRDIEELVKKHRQSAIILSRNQEERLSASNLGDGSMSEKEDERDTSFNTSTSSNSNPPMASVLDEYYEVVETQFTPRDENTKNLGLHRPPRKQGSPLSIQLLGEDFAEKVTALSDPGGPELSVSLTVSSDGEEDGYDDGQNVSGVTEDDTSHDKLNISMRSTPVKKMTRLARLSQLNSKDDSNLRSKCQRFQRQFSVGHNPPKKTRQQSSNDEFDRPLVRLSYGDRVQVASMNSRGWVKLARGHGFIRLENDKQLVKVGGSSDKACQIEALLHELSLERTRLKHEQTKLERLSAGLMIDLQSTLITSDDHVVVPAPEGVLQIESETDLSISLRKPNSGTVSIDDIDISARSRTVATPPRSQVSGELPKRTQSQPRAIRTAKSHSPGRTNSLIGNTPPSPPYGQSQPNATSGYLPNFNTPTRVSFRSGLSGHKALSSSYSGHRALSSSHSHPHDFLSGVNHRTYSNHAGIGTRWSKPSSRGRSMY